MGFATAVVSFFSGTEGNSRSSANLLRDEFFDFPQGGMRNFLSVAQKRNNAMPKRYRRLRKEDREVIYQMNQDQKSQREIARATGFSQGTISKELKRNRG